MKEVVFLAVNNFLFELLMRSIGCLIHLTAPHQVALALRMLQALSMRARVVCRRLLDLFGLLVTHLEKHPFSFLNRAILLLHVVVIALRHLRHQHQVLSMLRSRAQLNSLQRRSLGHWCILRRHVLSLVIRKLAGFDLLFITYARLIVPSGMCVKLTVTVLGMQALL